MSSQHEDDGYQPQWMSRGQTAVAEPGLVADLLACRDLLARHPADCPRDSIETARAAIETALVFLGWSGPNDSAAGKVPADHGRVVAGRKRPRQPARRAARIWPDLREE